MPFDADLQRKIFGQFATGVSVVGARRGDETRGMTANALASVSLEPPLVLVCVAKEVAFHSFVSEARAFSINILRTDQRELSERFAFTGPRDFSGLGTRAGKSGAPVLEKCLAWIDCKVHEVLPGGDHDVFVGEILEGGLGSGDPLIYYASGYTRLAHREP